MLSWYSKVTIETNQNSKSDRYYAMERVKKFLRFSFTAPFLFYPLIFLSGCTGGVCLTIQDINMYKPSDAVLGPPAAAISLLYDSIIPQHAVNIYCFYLQFQIVTRD